MDRSVSVVIATYNRSGVIGRAIESVLAQTYKDFEIVVIDDGSTDSTRDVVTAYGDRVRYYYQQNTGNYPARNRGIREARGRWIAWLDDDDQWHPDKLALQVEKIKQLPEPGFLWCNGYRGGVPYRDPGAPSGFFESMREIVAQPSAWLMSRSLFEKIGGFDTAYPTGGDTAFVMKALIRGIKIYYMKDLLVVWDNRVGRVSSFGPQTLVNREKRYRDFFDFIRKDRVFHFRYMCTMGRDAVRLGDKKRARRYFLKAFSLQPWKPEILARYFRAFGRPSKPWPSKPLTTGPKEV